MSAVRGTSLRVGAVGITEEQELHGLQHLEYQKMD